MKLLGIDFSSDDSLVHPQSFCYSCFRTADRISSSKSEPPHWVVEEWLPHDENDCEICDKKCKGGRPKKRRSSGRPKKRRSSGRPSALTKHLQTIATTKYDFSLDVLSGSYKENYTCVFCESFVVRPVEIQPCKTLACLSCCLDVSLVRVLFIAQAILILVNMMLLSHHSLRYVPLLRKY